VSPHPAQPYSNDVAEREVFANVECYVGSAKKQSSDQSLIGDDVHNGWLTQGSGLGSSLETCRIPTDCTAEVIRTILAALSSLSK
jgi:hypothetical protein